MARIFIESFETQSLDLWSTTSQASIISSSGYDMKGNRCCSIVSAGYIKRLFSSNLTNFWVAFLWRKKEYSWYMVTVYSNTGSALLLMYYRHGYNNINYLVGGSSTGGTKDVYDNITYFVQVHFYFSGNRAYITAYIDGVHDKSYSNSTSSISFSEIGFGGGGYFDNIVIDGSTMPEETEISVLRPNGVGHYSDFVPTPSGSNYTCVDEIPYNDSDFVSSGIVNAIDTYTLEDMSNAKSVKCVQMQARARKDSDSPLTKFNFVMRNNSTDYHGNDISLSNTFSPYSEMYLSGPTGSGSWRQSNVDSLEIGVRTRT
jgi:hypothetical protein